MRRVHVRGHLCLSRRCAWELCLGAISCLLWQPELGRFIFLEWFHANRTSQPKWLHGSTAFLMACSLMHASRRPPPRLTHAACYADRDKDAESRPAVITVMGHVDHGKACSPTSLYALALAMYVQQRLVNNP